MSFFAALLTALSKTATIVKQYQKHGYIDIDRNLNVCIDSLRTQIRSDLFEYFAMKSFNLISFVCKFNGLNSF